MRRWIGVLQNQRANHIISTNYEAIHPTNYQYLMNAWHTYTTPPPPKKKKKKKKKTHKFKCKNSSNVDDYWWQNHYDIPLTVIEISKLHWFISEY